MTRDKLLECNCRSAPARQLILFLQRNVRIALRAHFACAALMSVDRRAIVCHYRNPLRTSIRMVINILIGDSWRGGRTQYSSARK